MSVWVRNEKGDELFAAGSFEIYQTKFDQTWRLVAHEESMTALASFEAEKLAIAQLDDLQEFIASGAEGVYDLRERKVVAVIEKEEPVAKFKVGDLVRIRAWEGLVEEYGPCSETEDGVHLVNTPPPGFTGSMRPVCGLVGRIATILDTGYVRFEDDWYKGPEDRLWHYADWMLEPVAEETEGLEAAEEEQE